MSLGELQGGPLHETGYTPSAHHDLWILVSRKQHVLAGLFLHWAQVTLLTLKQAMRAGSSITHVLEPSHLVHKLGRNLGGQYSS